MAAVVLCGLCLVSHTDMNNTLHCFQGLFLLLLDGITLMGPALYGVCYQQQHNEYGSEGNQVAVG